MKRHFRLDPRVRPLRYTLHFDLDLDAWTFRGVERLELETDDERREIVLHARDLALVSVPLAFDATLEPEADALVLRYHEPLAPGRHVVELEFTGLIRPDLKALYRSVSGDERYAITTLWPAESRRLFPCFDEPPFKARFALSLTAPAALTAVANARVTDRADAGNGRARWRFAETPPLSPYLLAFAVGPFAGTPEERTRGGAPVRVWVPRGLEQDATYARDAQRDAIDWLETYTDIRYPYDKVEGVGVRDFPAGAMENPGAVTYRLELVTADPRRASARALKSTVGVAAHELTHMWWGDLATLAWWDDLWLSESFATFVGNKCEDALHPEWSIWRDFTLGTTRGFGLDALASTHAIHAEAESAEAALERVDAVTYQKGAAVLRMLEAYLGEEAFRAGVRRYLERFAGSCARAHDFWDALGGASGQDIGRVAEAWITEPGHPIVDVRRAANGRLALRQRRFFHDPDATASTQRWPIPLVLRTPEGEHRVLLDKEHDEVALDAAWVFPNARATGFYRFSLARDLREALLAQAPALDPLERLLWVDNDWTLVRAGSLTIGDYLGLLRALEGEQDRVVLTLIAESLRWIDAHAAPGHAAIRDVAARMFRPVLARLGWDPRDGDDADDLELRGIAIFVLGAIARSSEVRTEATRRITAHLDGARQPPDLVAPCAFVAACGGDAALQARYAARLREAAASDPQDERNFLAAIAGFENERAARQTIALMTSHAVRDQDIGRVYFEGMRNAAARRWYWDDLRAGYATRVAPLEAMVRNGVLSTVTQLTPPDLAKAADAFLASVQQSDNRESIEQMRESLRLSSRSAARIASELAAS